MPARVKKFLILTKFEKYCSLVFVYLYDPEEYEKNNNQTNNDNGY
jgi:hypothetical protein